MPIRAVAAGSPQRLIRIRCGKSVVASILRAESSQRGRTQAENFSIDHYRERVGVLYPALA